MQLRTLARDCLYLNWALPLDSAPELPPPLRYEVHRWQDGDWVFASALLSRLSGLQLAAISFPRLSYPQMTLGLFVLDGDGKPAVLYLCLLVPPWVVPVSRLMARQPASAADFSYPSPSREPDKDSWSWTVRRHHRLEVVARLAAPQVGPGPQLGSWNRTVDYFRNRRLGYRLWEGRLRPIKTSRPAAEVWPLEVEIKDADLVGDCLAKAEAEVLKSPHSAWLCPEIPFIFELAKPMTLPLAPRARVPAAEGLLNRCATIGDHDKH